MDEQIATEIAYKNGYKKGTEDAVRKMAERLKAKAMDFDMDDATLWISVVPFDDIDQIAKEILEGEK